MATKHSFSELDLTVEDWNSYLERLDFFLEAGGIQDLAIQLSTFLSSVGPSIYKLIRNLCCPKLPKLLQSHF